MGDYYVLNSRLVVPVSSATKWAEWFEKADRRVGLTSVAGYNVSTVFFGMDHQYGDGPPLVFETMVFPGGTLSEVACYRYSTWREAERGHRRAIRWAKRRFMELECRNYYGPPTPNAEKGE